MNANELADNLENTDEGSGYLGVLSLEAATMLRQQQAEIEALKKAFESVCDGMQTSLELNKAQAERYWSERK